MTIKNTNIPTLRFAEFTDDWEVKKLGEVAKISSGGTPSRTNLNYWNGDIPWVSTTLIDFNIIDRTEEYITEEGLRNSSAKLFPKGTLLMAMYGQGKTRGKISILNIEASTNQACGAIISDNKVLNSLFAFQNLASRYDEIRDLSNQGGQENLSGGIIKNIKISLSTLPEQTKIANFLTAIDDKIQQLSEQKSLLEQYKKGIMQKIFSREIRFKPNTTSEYPDWEEKSLGEVATFSKGKGISKMDIDENGVFECIRYGELYTFYGETIKEIKSKTSLSAKELVFSEYNDVIIPASGETQLDIATASCVLKDNVALGGDLNIIKTKLDGVWLSYYLNNCKKKDIASLAQGISVVHLYASQLKTLFISIPSLPEQQKIATFLTGIDEKINGVKERLEATKAYKKGLLQVMFV